jgi:hypothetical protein
MITSKFGYLVTVLEKRDRQVHELWTAGLGVTFVVVS